MSIRQRVCLSSICSWQFIKNYIIYNIVFYNQSMLSAELLGSQFLPSMGRTHYPNTLSSPTVIMLIQHFINASNWVLSVADIGCWNPSISHNLFPDAKRFLVDKDITPNHSSNSQSFQLDMRDMEQLKQAQTIFFNWFHPGEKDKFDIILLSNVLNYFIGNDERLKEWEISPIMEDFWHQFIEKYLSKEWFIVIQNGNKSNRYATLEESQVNEYFGSRMESLITKEFEDVFYLWVAMAEERRDDGSTPVAGLLTFSSLEEYERIRNSGLRYAAVNVRTLRRR